MTSTQACNLVCYMARKRTRREVKVIVIQSFDVKAEALIGKEWSAS